METTGAIPEGLYTYEQESYVNSVPDSMLREHLLYQVRLRDLMEKDRNAFQKMYTDLSEKYIGLTQNSGRIK